MAPKHYIDASSFAHLPKLSEADPRPTFNLAEYIGSKKREHSGRRAEPDRVVEPQPATAETAEPVSAATIFQRISEIYQEAVATNRLEAWQAVRDMIMNNLSALCLTRLVSFKDAMAIAMEIDERLLKGKNVDQDPLREIARAWSLPEGGRATDAGDED